MPVVVITENTIVMLWDSNDKLDAIKCLRNATIRKFGVPLGIKFVKCDCVDNSVNMVTVDSCGETLDRMCIVNMKSKAFRDNIKARKEQVELEMRQTQEHKYYPA
jgi:hypothetical protein